MAPSAFLLFAMCLGAAAPGNALEHPSVPSRSRPTVTEVEPRARIRVRREAPPPAEERATEEAPEDEDDEGTCGLPAEASAGQEATNASVGLSTGRGQLAAEEGSPEVAGAPTSSLSVNSTSPRGGDAIAGLLSTGRGAATEAGAAAEEAAVDASDAGDEETCSPPAEGADEQRTGHASASLLELPGNSSVRAAENSSGVSLRVASGPQQQTVAAHSDLAAGAAILPPLPQSLQERLALKHVVGAGLRGAPEAKQGDGGEGPSLLRRGLRLLAQGTVLAVLAKASHHAYTARTPKLPL